MIHQQLWGYKIEEKLHLGVREQKKIQYHWIRHLLAGLLCYVLLSCSLCLLLVTQQACYSFI
jgi:hypothetical protein